MALATVSVLYGGLHAVLTSAAGWTERHATAMPYQAGEDPLRFLLPSLMRRPDRGRTLILGPSAAGENLLRESFTAAFPDRPAFTAGISNGTLDDALVALEYVEDIHGPDAMPQRVVLGVTPRFVANIPRRFGPAYNPFAIGPTFDAINQFSAHVRVEPTPMGSRLVPKPWLAGLRARVRFVLRKQQPRHRAALAAGADALLGRLGVRPAEEPLPAVANVTRPLTPPNIGILRSYAARNGALRAFRRWVPAYNSPYVTHYLTPRGPDQVRERLRAWPGWRAVHAWDPAADAALVRAQVDRLLALAHRHAMALFVVNLPEHPIHRGSYEEARYDAYLDLVRSALGATPFLNLDGLLPASAFYDEVHATRSGAERISSETITFVARHLR